MRLTKSLHHLIRSEKLDAEDKSSKTDLQLHVTWLWCQPSHDTIKLNLALHSCSHRYKSLALNASGLTFNFLLFHTLWPKFDVQTWNIYQKCGRREKCPCYALQSAISDSWYTSKVLIPQIGTFTNRIPISLGPGNPPQVLQVWVPVQQSSPTAASLSANIQSSRATTSLSENKWEESTGLCVETTVGCSEQHISAT